MIKIFIAVVAQPTMRGTRWPPQVACDTPLQLYLLPEVIDSLIAGRGSQSATTVGRFFISL
jgi:hypothetical protein